jgi:hypothetical protein
MTTYGNLQGYSSCRLKAAVLLALVHFGNLATYFKRKIKNNIYIQKEKVFWGKLPLQVADRTTDISLAGGITIRLSLAGLFYIAHMKGKLHDREDDEHSNRKQPEQRNSQRNAIGHVQL